MLDANEYPRVTEHIGAIHELISQLEAKGYAYAVGGDVYYRVRQFEEYGKLSGRSLETIQAGTRVLNLRENQLEFFLHFFLISVKERDRAL